MKKNKAIFLDRDGTIICDYGYVYELDKLNFLFGAIAGLKKLYDAGYELIIITNQSGIGRKYYTVEQYQKFTNCMLKILKQNGILIREVYYCPHIDSDQCECRKPKLGLFYQAIEKYNIDLENSFAIGDKERDLAICKETNIKGVLLNSKNDRFVCLSNLDEAANYILENQNI